MTLLAVVLAAQTMAPPFRVVDKGPRSGIQTARQVVIRTAAEWADLWRVHAANRERPTIDFDREMVVGVFLGTRPTAGYGVEITGIEEQDGVRVVRYRETIPPRDAITAQVLTSPFVLVTIPKAAGDVRFEASK